MTSHSAKIAADLPPLHWGDLDLRLDELAQSAVAERDSQRFYQQLLQSLAQAVGAQSCAIWLACGPNPNSIRLELEIHNGESATSSLTTDSRLPFVTTALQTLEPRFVSPGQALSGTETSQVWRFAHPVALPDGRRVALELALQSSRPDQAQHYLGLLDEYGQLLLQHLQNCELAELRERFQQQHSLTAFRRRIHADLKLDAVGFALVNDLRNIAKCDRVSLLIPHGHAMRLLATSGTIEPQASSTVVVQLQNLATAVAKTKEPVWHLDDDTHLPEQVATPLHALLESSAARQVAVLPLLPEDSDAEVRGLLVVEQFHRNEFDAFQRQVISELLPDCACAIANSLTHERQPLSRMGRLLAKSQWLVAARQLPKTLLATGLLAVAIAILTFVPADFYVEAAGELQPRVRHDIFATEDGVVSEIFVKHGDEVQTEQPTLTLIRPELDLEQKRIAGELQTVRQKLLAVQSELLANSQRGGEAARTTQQMTAEQSELQSREQGLSAQSDLLRREREQLTLRSPIHGQVLTFNVDQLLHSRPVSRGQSLLTVGDLSGEWELDLRVPDKRAGHVIVERDKTEPLPILFVLTAEPGKMYSARLTGLATRAEMDDAHVSTVRMTADFDKATAGKLHPGATVTAKIYCGRRSLGFIYLHDVWDFLVAHGWW